MRDCKYCDKKHNLKAPQCSSCYRKYVAPKGECDRCGKHRPLRRGSCWSCYNYYKSTDYKGAAFKKYGRKCQNKDCVVSSVIEIPDKMFDIDHIIPRCEGGKNNVENLQVLCVWCHALKTRGVDLAKKLSPATTV